MNNSKATNKWKPGYPPGKYYPGMENDFEVCFTVGGMIWHRQKAKAAPTERKEAK